jgi:hypothetical protein
MAWLVGEVVPGIGAAALVAVVLYIVACAGIEVAGIVVAGIVVAGIVGVELAGSEPVAAVGCLWLGSHLCSQACMAIV